MSSPVNKDDAEGGSASDDQDWIENANIEDLEVLDEASGDEDIIKVKKEPIEVDTENGKKKDKERDKRSSRESARDQKKSHSRERVESWQLRNRNRSPIRRRSPPPPRRRSTEAKKSFLDDLKSTLEKEGKDTSFLNEVDRHGNATRRPNDRLPRNRSNNFSSNNFNRQQQQQHFMQQQNMMMGNNYNFQPYMQPNMMMGPFQQYNAAPMMSYDTPYMYNANPLMAMHEFPQPVPAPEIVPPPITDVMPQPMQPQPKVTKIVVPPKVNEVSNSKAPGSNLGLLDILRKKSKQQNNDQLSSAALASVKAKASEKCDKAEKLIKDLENKKTIFPFTYAHTVVPTPSIKQGANNDKRSPLMMSDHNVCFQFQTPASRCRAAFERNPLKLLHESTELLQPLAQNMKLDTLELALRVRSQVLTKDYSEPKITKEVRREINAMAKAPTAEISHELNKFCQTDPIECRKCRTRAEIKNNVKSVGIQAVSRQGEHGTQYSTNDGSFNFTIDAVTMQDMNYNQKIAFQDFLREFNIPFREPSVSSDIQSRLSEIRRNVSSGRDDEKDDRLNYANPENPGEFSSHFINTSPPTRRSNILSRVGSFVPDTPEDYDQPYIVPSPRKIRFSPSPLRARFSRSPIYNNTRRNRSRSLSPLARNRSPDRRRSPTNNFQISPRTLRSPRQRLNSRSPKRARFDDDDYQYHGQDWGRNRRGRY